MFRWIEHTGELELELESPTAEDVFADALAAIAELLDAEARGHRSSREVIANAPDRPALLAAWLEELVFFAETEGFIPEAAESVELRDNEVRARIWGHSGDPPHLVKAVTYHALELERADGGWRGRAVLDV